MLRSPEEEVARVYVANRLPDIGESIGEYKVVEVLGRGGHGVVFRVERGLRSYVAKFLLAPELDGRAEREISVLNHLDNPCVVRYVGSDFWPNPVTGRPYIIMEYVPGDTLEAFAFRVNPSSRKATRIILDIARTLGEIHGVGVFHRDLKPTNIVIRGAAERPVLIDFGIAALAGASCLTGTRLPPATDEYRAPDPLRFERNNPSGTARYEFSHTDELWALGVTFYWLLTDELPFGERTDDGGERGLRERILTQRPIAPHRVNPRVPLAASRLCMTMLAEWSADRFPSVQELCRALQKALATAEDDRAWDVPLVDPYDPQASTTVEDPALVEPNEELGAFRRQGKRRPRRGLLRPNEAFAPVESPAPVKEPEQDQLPTEDRLQVRAHVASRPRTDPPILPVRREPRLGRGGLLAGLAGLTLAAGVWLYLERETAAPERHTSAPEPELDAKVLSGSTKPNQALGYPLPTKPFRNQAKAPCYPELDEVEINGGCWTTLERRPPCLKDVQAEHKGKCYLPISNDRERGDPPKQSVEP